MALAYGPGDLVTVSVPGERRRRVGLVAQIEPATVRVRLQRTPELIEQHGRFAPVAVGFCPESCQPVNPQEVTDQPWL